MSFSPLLPLVSALLLTTLMTTAQPFPVGAPAPSAGTIVTITHVRTPWYGFRWLLKHAFRKAVPEYAAIRGLRQKNFMRTADRRFFGGVYLWQDEAAARAWFGPSWFAQVRQRFHTEGEVAYYQVIASETFDHPAPVGPYYTVLAFGRPVPTAASAAGLLRLTTLHEHNRPERIGILTLWRDRTSAERHYGRVGGQSDVQFFDSPVLIDQTL